MKWFIPINDYWYSNITCQVVSRQTYPCEEIYFSKKYINSSTTYSNCSMRMKSYTKFYQWENQTRYILVRFLEIRSSHPIPQCRTLRNRMYSLLTHSENSFESSLPGKWDERQHIDDFSLFRLSRTTYWVLLCFNRGWIFLRIYFSLDNVVDEER
jgi:hypothetical protein